MSRQQLWRVAVFTLLFALLSNTVQISASSPRQPRRVVNAFEMLSQNHIHVDELGEVQSLSSASIAPENTSPAAPVSAVAANATQNILYDQTDNPGGGFTSQKFEPAFTDFDSQGADDFIIPASDGQWTIERVELLGSYSDGGGPTPLVNVYFYADAAGLPGATVYNAEGVVPADDVTGDLTIDLPAPVVLSAGTYWLSVQADMDFDSKGSWFWTNRTIQSNNPYAWRNPGNGFGSGCSTWGLAAADCGLGANGEPDTLFRLLGTKSPTEWKIYLPGIANNWTPPTPPSPPDPADLPCLYAVNWWRNDSWPYNLIHSTYSPSCLLPKAPVTFVPILGPQGQWIGYQTAIKRQSKPDFDMDVNYIFNSFGGVIGANVIKTYKGGQQYQMTIIKFCPTIGQLMGYKVRFSAPPYNGQEVTVGICL